LRPTPRRQRERLRCRGRSRGSSSIRSRRAGASTIINMVTYGEKREPYQQNNQIIDRLFYWYAEQDSPHPVQ